MAKAKKPIPPQWQALMDTYPGTHDISWYRKYLVVISQNFVSIQGVDPPWTFNAVTTTNLAKQASDDFMKLSKKDRRLLAKKAVDEYKSFAGGADESTKSLLKSFDPNL